VRTLTGVGSTPLSGIGTARWYDPADDLTLPDRSGSASNDPATASNDPAAERDRFEDARTTAREGIRRARERAADRVGEEEAAVFDAHEAFLDDPGLIDDIETAIDEGALAEHAVDDRFGEAIARFEGMEGRTGGARRRPP